MTPVWLHHIETIVPKYSYSQEYAGRKMEALVAGERDKRLVRAIYRTSGIKTRHSVIATFHEGSPDDFLKVAPDGKIREPGTAARNDIFIRESRAMAEALADRLMKNAPGIEPKDITHVVTASCTGFHCPGFDYHVARRLGLPFSTERYHLGFMGCYAAFPALRMAAQFCRAAPDAVVLVMCLELCSLHLQINKGQDAILANSLFSDGAGAAFVTARAPGTGGSAYRISDFATTLVPEGVGDMAWSLGDHGFDIVLSSYVPKVLEGNVRDFVEPALARRGLGLGDIATWAVHPGGKSIVDKVQQSLGLEPRQVETSRRVLRDYGNMSSATIFFVLQDLLRQPAPAPQETVCALAFGPGLTVEMALLEAQRG
jgi:predicted naringenin-chalcone synthase